MTVMIITITLAYLIGSLNMSIIVAKLSGKADPRTQGSGNAGATNMLRNNGKKYAIIVLLGDALKGVIAILIAKALHLPENLLGFIALAAIAGHIFPVFFRFKGGKGVATLVGVLIALNWLIGLIAIAAWIIIAILTRFASLASICAAIITVITSFVLGMQNYTLALLLMALLVIWKHKENIKRLMTGTESKIGSPSKK